MTIDPELRRIVEVWATLNERDRRILLGLVDALRNRQRQDASPIQLEQMVETPP